MVLRAFGFFVLFGFAALAEVPPVKDGAELALDEDWSKGIDPQRWYVMRRDWGNRHHGVVPENVQVEEERGEDGVLRKVLVCHAHGERW